MKGKLIWLGTVLLSLLLLFVGNRVASKGLTAFSGTEEAPFLKVSVVEVIGKERVEPRFAGMEVGDSVNIRFRARILSGEERGEVVEGMQNIDPMLPFPMTEASPGVKFLLTKDQTGMYEPDVWYVAQEVRSDALLWLGAAFALCLLVFGRSKGLNTIISLGFTCVSIFTVLIPAILSGKNIYLWTLGICSYIVIMTLLVVTGTNRKSLAAGLGCGGGVLVAGGLTLLMGRIMNLTGMVDEQSWYLQFLNGEEPIDLRAVIFAAILIGAIGAVMDVAVSIAAALHEVWVKADAIGVIELIRSGFTIGRDMIGTMANTLVLAYIGSSLSTVLLLIAYHPSLLALLNREMIATEILQALAGSFGILLTIPLTSVICGLLYAGHTIRPGWLGRIPKQALGQVRRLWVREAPESAPLGGLTQYDAMLEKSGEKEKDEL